MLACFVHNSRIQCVASMMSARLLESSLQCDHCLEHLVELYIHPELQLCKTKAGLDGDTSATALCTLYCSHSLDQHDKNVSALLALHFFAMEVAVVVPGLAAEFGECMSLSKSDLSFLRKGGCR